MSKGGLTVTYEVVDLDTANVLAHYGTREEALRSVERHLSEHPEMADELVLVAVDDDGHAIGEPLPAGASLPRQPVRVTGRRLSQRFPGRRRSYSRERSGR
jgi:hypothetical protein